jgi:uncharacterized protein YkwD
MIRRTVPPLLAAAIVALGAFGAAPAGAAALPGHPAHPTTLRSHHRPAAHHRRPRTSGGLLVAPADQAAALALAPAPIAACPNADLIPNPGNLAAVATATLCLVNQARARHGVDALVDDSSLDQSARSHNDAMINGNFFDPGGLLGDALRRRVLAAGYSASLSTPYSLGENIAFGVLDRGTPRAIVDGWDAVPGYLANILDPSFSNFGIAVDASAPAILSTGLSAATYTLDFGSA